MPIVLPSPEDAATLPPPDHADLSGATLRLPRAQPSRWPMRRAWIARQVPIVLVMMLASYLITLNVGTPWQSIHEDNGTLNESIALNHLRFGLGVTKGQDLLDLEAKQSFGPPGVSEAQHFAYFLSGPTHPQVYGDHPPLLGLTIAGSFLLFGPHFWSERLVVIIYALGGLLLFYLLVARVFDRGVAVCAALLYAVCPMFAYFGRNVSHEAPTLFWALLLLWGYVCWREHNRWRWGMLMAVATTIGGGYGWPLFYFAVILWVLDGVWARRPNWRLAATTVLPAIVTFIAVMGQIAWALNGDLSHLATMFLYRTGGAGDAPASAMTAISWLNQVTIWNAEGFGAWSQVAILLACGFVAMRHAAEGWSPRLRMVVLLGVWGISHVLIFRNGAYIHAYWQFYLIPFYALTLGWAAVSLARHTLTARRSRWLLLAGSGFVVLCLNFAPIVALYSTGYHRLLPVTPLFDLWH